MTTTSPLLTLSSLFSSLPSSFPSSHLLSSHLLSSHSPSPSAYPTGIKPGCFKIGQHPLLYLPLSSPLSSLTPPLLISSSLSPHLSTLILSSSPLSSLTQHSSSPHHPSPPPLHTHPLLTHTRHLSPCRLEALSLAVSRLDNILSSAYPPHHPSPPSSLTLATSPYTHPLLTHPAGWRH